MAIGQPAIWLVKYWKSYNQIFTHVFLRPISRIRRAFLLRRERMCRAAAFARSPKLPLPSNQALYIIYYWSPSLSSNYLCNFLYFLCIYILYFFISPLLRRCGGIARSHYNFSSEAYWHSGVDTFKLIQGFYLVRLNFFRVYH